MKSKTFNALLKYRYQVRKSGVLFIVFTIVKSLVFFAPISISYLLNDPELYGQFEYTLGLGQTFMSFFSMGMSTSVAYFLLKKKKEYLKPAFYLHFAIISGVLLLVLAFFSSLIDSLIYGSVIIGAAFAYQIFNASYLRIEEKNIQSVFADSAIYLLMGVYAVLLYFRILEFDHKTWHLLVLGQLVVSNIFKYQMLFGIGKIKWEEYYEIYKYGLFTVLTGLALYTLTNSTRIFIELYTSYTDVGIYSYYFRIGCLVVVLYRVIGIIMFKKYFVSEHPKIDTFFSLLIPGLFILNILIFVFLIGVIRYFPHLIEGSFISQIQIYPLILFQVNFWIGVSLLESIIYREDLSLRMFIVMGICLLLFMGVLYWLDKSSKITLSNIVAFNILFILLSNLGQIYILKERIYFYKKTLLSQIGISLLFAVYALLYL